MAKKKKGDGTKALIESVRAAGDRAVHAGEALTRPKGLSNARLAKLRLPSGKPVTGSLAA